MPKLIAGRSFLGTFVLVFLAIAVLFVVDTFLAKAEHAEREAEAARLFEQGRSMIERGKSAEGIEVLQDALSIDRNNRDYRLTLAQAQLGIGKTADADATLTELLQTDPTDGLTNLIMARVLLKQGRFADAISYFHRAIYGHWNQDEAGNRLRVRFELINLLATRNSKEELLAELLLVQEDATHDLKTGIRTGRLFLQAGSPARAAEVFREILHDAPDNGEAYAGLGEAEFARGNYRLAQRDFLAAVRWAPDDQAARQRLDFSNELLRLDPTIRDLSAAERFRRSLKLVELTLDEVRNCIGQNPSQDVRGLLDKATAALAAHVGAAHQNEASESNLDLAEQLWQARKKECKSPPAGNTPLALVLARLAQ